ISSRAACRPCISSRVSVYFPSDGCHTALSDDSIPQSSYVFHTQLRRDLCQLHFYTISLKKALAKQVLFSTKIALRASEIALQI
ncbi:MAG: hypothetical protein IJW69_02160, partial [Clostridia bacterium]|nr:hypothetical protein [Clostridia bacterium]